MSDQQFRPFTGKARRLGAEGDPDDIEVSEQPRDSQQPEDSQNPGDSQQPEDSQQLEYYDLTNDEKEEQPSQPVIPVPETQVASTELPEIAECVDAVEKLLVVAKSWKVELPVNKYTEDAHKEVDEFIVEAEPFAKEVTQQANKPVLGVSYHDIVNHALYHKHELSLKWVSAKNTVDFLLGRASSEVRKLKREGSDTSDLKRSRR